MINNDWDEKLKIIWDSPGFKKFYHVVEEEYRHQPVIYPVSETHFKSESGYRDAAGILPYPVKPCRLRE